MRHSINYCHGAQGSGQVPGPLGTALDDERPFRGALRLPEAWRRPANTGSIPVRPAHDPDRRPPLSGKQSNPQTTRRDRRAADRRDRFEVARDERRARTASTRGGSRGGGGGSNLFTTRNVTIAAILAGVLIVVVVAVNQLGTKATGNLIDPGTSYPAALLDGHALGKSTAPVTLDVYEDFQCPYCAQYALSVEPIIVSDYVASGQARIVHHDFVFLDRVASDYESKLTAIGAYCADQQGKYWIYAHWVYANQSGENAGGFRRERLTAIATAAGLDATAFSTCLDSQDASTFVAATTTKASSLPVVQTPTIYVNGTEWKGASLVASSIEALIKSELAKTSASPAASTSPAPSTSTTP